MAIVLNNETKLSIEKITGISYEDIVSMDVDILRNRIEKKIGKKLKFKPDCDRRLPNRGSVYLFLHRFFDFNIKKLNKYIESL